MPLGLLRAPEGVALQVLGSGGPRAGTESASASYLVWVDGEARAMLDVGGGAFLRFGEAGASLASLQLLGLSHFHPDHVSDLAALLWLSDLERSEPLPIAGPSGNSAYPSLDEHLERLFDPRAGAFRVLSGTLGGPGRGVRLEPITVDVAIRTPVTLLETPGLTVTALSVPHTNSPSLAYRIAALERDVAVLPRRVGVALVAQHIERGDQSRPALARVDHVVDVAPGRRDVRVGELLAVLRDARLRGRSGIVRGVDLLPEEDLDGALGSHDGDLGLRPG